MEHCVNDEVLGPIFWNIIVLKKKVEYAEALFGAFEDFAAQMFEILEQHDDSISDVSYRSLAKILDGEVEWLGNVESRLLFWYDLLEKLKKTSIQKS